MREGQFTPAGAVSFSAPDRHFYPDDFAGTVTLAYPSAAVSQHHEVQVAPERREFQPEARFQQFLHPYQPIGRSDNPVHGPNGEELVVDVSPLTREDGSQYIRIDQDGQAVEYPYLNGEYYVRDFDKWYKGVNGLVHDQSYYTLAEHPHIATSVVTSWYGSLRRWERKNNPEAYQKTVENFQAVPDREYRVLADPGGHHIMPLLPTYEDKSMMVERGLKSFEADLGFRPKGMWLPECAVDMETLEALVERGVEFTVLKSLQLKSTDQNPMWVKTSRGDIAIFHFDAEESGAIAFNADRTVNADDFLRGMRDKSRATGNKTMAIGMDYETRGHHKKDRDKFGEYSDRRDVMAKWGLAPFDIQAMIDTPEEERVYTEIHENSSWSCWHGVDRWTGGEGCNCAGHESHAVKQEKQYLYQTLNSFNIDLAQRLDAFPNWREAFVDFSLAMDVISESREGIWEAVAALSQQPGMELLQNPTAARYMMAEYYTILGRTSCGWFFNEGGIEKQIPWFGIEVVRNLVPDIGQQAQQPSQDIYIATA